MLGAKQQFFIKVLIGVVCVVIWLSYSISFFVSVKPAYKNNEIAISEKLGSGRWEVVSGGLLGDIRRIAFDKTGQTGIAISLEGHLLNSTNGGLTWDSFGKMPFVNEDGKLSWNEEEISGVELVNALTVTDKGLFIGTAVDESTYGAIYQLDNKGNWKVQIGNYGGLLNSTSCNSNILSNSNNNNSSSSVINTSSPNDYNSPVMVGSNGLIVELLPNLGDSSLSTNRQNSTTSQTQQNAINSQDIAYQQLPLWAQINLYSVDQKDKNLVVAGDYGLVCKSNDAAKSWKNISPDKTNKLPFYATAIGNEMILAGGNNGNFWRLDEKTNIWQKVTGLKSNLTVFAIYADKEGNCVAGGGELTGNSPFILYSSDNGLSWYYELIPQSYGRITSIAKSSSAILASTIDGHILLHKINDDKE